MVQFGDLDAVANDDGSNVSVTIGDIDLTATGAVLASATLSINAESSNAYATASVIVGDIAMSAISTGNTVNDHGSGVDLVITGTNFDIDGSTDITVGNISLTVDANVGHEVYATESWVAAEAINLDIDQAIFYGGNITIGNLEVNLLGEAGEGNVDIGGNLSGNYIDMGNVTANVDTTNLLTMSFDNIEWDKLRSGSFVGSGDLMLNIDSRDEGTAVFGSLNFDGFTGNVNISFHSTAWDDDATDLVSTDRTSIFDWDPAKGSITFDGITAGTNFNASSVSDVTNDTQWNALWSDLDNAIDGTTIQYAFAHVDETQLRRDVNGGGLSTDVIVLAFDLDGNGLTNVIYFDGVTAGNFGLSYLA